MKKKVIAAFLAMTLAAGMLAGCGSSQTSAGSEENSVVLNETMSSDTKWINSQIEGAINEDTEVSVKDDFFTACNKDWLVSTTVDKDNPAIYEQLQSSIDLLNSRTDSILKGEEDPDAKGNAPVPENILSHSEELVQTFANAAGNWDQRNADGVEPIREYLENIEAIENMDQMNAFILDEDETNLFALGLLDLSVSVSEKEMADEDVEETQINYLHLRDTSDLSLGSKAVYTGDYTMLNDSYYSSNIDRVKSMIQETMEKLGYSDSEISSLITDCFRFESDMVDHMYPDDYFDTDSYYEQCGDISSVADAEAMAGSYPLAELLEVYGYDTDQIIIRDPDYVKYISEIYNEQHLDEIKAYLLINTLVYSLRYLDETSYDLFNGETADNITITFGSEGGQAEEGYDSTEALDKQDRIARENINTYLKGPLNEIYVARYVTSEEKEDISNLVDSLIDYYYQMLASEDWMSEETREGAYAKLDNLTKNILYPDTFVAYDYLDYGDDTELLDLIADINAQRRGSDADMIGQIYDPCAWDFADIPTLDVNASYVQNYNSINILAGYIAGNVYDVDMPIEEKYALLGCTIGHEITHAFDTNGADFDYKGRYINWWTEEDQVTFENKCKKLINYMNAFVQFPGAKSTDGQKVSGEMIADMGGLKAILGLAAGIDGFDYEKFFRAYATTLASKETYSSMQRYLSDEHPCACVRVNVAVMQYDEFAETFDIQKGDGMYLEEKDRLTVW